VHEALKRYPSSTPVLEDGKYGGSWSTHWFFLTFSLPPSWLAQLQNPARRIHFLWDSGCEATLYNMQGKMLQAFTEN